MEGWAVSQLATIASKEHRRFEITLSLDVAEARSLRDTLYRAGSSTTLAEGSPEELLADELDALLAGS